MPSYLWYAIWLPVCGLAALATLITANSLVQVNSDPAIRGRVMGIYMLIFMGGTPFGSPLIGIFSELFGVRWTIAGCGFISLAAAVTIGLVFRGRAGVPKDISVESVLKAADDDNQNEAN